MHRLLDERLHLEPDEDVQEDARAAVREQRLYDFGVAEVG
jgi:hypothetical protein